MRVFKLFVLTGLLFLPSFASAQIALHSVGSTNSSTSTISITPSSNIPAGSLIVVAVQDRNGGVGTMSVDGGGNSYTKAVQQLFPGGGPPTAVIFYVYNCLAVSTAQSITYNNFGGGGSGSVMSVAYATGVQTLSNPLDVTANASGSSASPTVTSAAPAVKNELFIGVLGTQNFTDALTQASGWSSTMTIPGGFVDAMLIGDLINASTGTKTYNPTIAGSHDWAIVVASFKPGPVSTFIFTPAVIP